jgi:hypothetical protein
MTVKRVPNTDGDIISKMFHLAPSFSVNLLLNGKSGKTLCRKYTNNESRLCVGESLLSCFITIGGIKNPPDYVGRAPYDVLCSLFRTCRYGHRGRYRGFPSHYPCHGYRTVHHDRSFHSYHLFYLLPHYRNG